MIQQKAIYTVWADNEDCNDDIWKTNSNKKGLREFKEAKYWPIAVRDQQLMKCKMNQIIQNAFNPHFKRILSFDRMQRLSYFFFSKSWR